MGRTQYITVMCLICLFAGLILGGSVVSSQSEDGVCSGIATLAIDSTETYCEGAGRNQVCYGHILVEAQPQDGAGAFVFADTGDVVDLLDVRSLILTPMNETTQEWGISLMRLQANLPAATEQYATLLAFGDVQLDNAAGDLPTLEVTATTFANVRRRPTVDDFVLTSLRSAQTVVADGRLEDISWVRVMVPETGETGWISASLVQADESLETLAVVPAGSTHYAPFQAFFLRTGVSDAPCAEAPESGILIQTPEGVAEIRLQINEIAIHLGSTAFIQAMPGGDFIFNLLEGTSLVEAAGVTQRVFPGTRVRVPLDANGHAAGSPSVPEPYNMTGLTSLPLGLLERVIEIAPPLTWPQIYALLGQSQNGGNVAISGESGSTGAGSGGDSGGNENPVGGSETAVVGEGASAPAGDEGGASAPAENNVAITHASYSSGNRQVNLHATYNGGVDSGVSLTASPGGGMEILGDHYQLVFTVSSDCPCTITVTSSTGASASTVVGP